LYDEPCYLAVVDIIYSSQRSRLGTLLGMQELRCLVTLNRGLVELVPEVIRALLFVKSSAFVTTERCIVGRRRRFDGDGHVLLDVGVNGGKNSGGGQASHGYAKKVEESE